MERRQQFIKKKRKKLYSIYKLLTKSGKPSIKSGLNNLQVPRFLSRSLNRVSIAGYQTGERYSKQERLMELKRFNYTD